MKDEPKELCFRIKLDAAGNAIVDADGKVMTNGVTPVDEMNQRQRRKERAKHIAAIRATNPGPELEGQLLGLSLYALRTIAEDRTVKNG